MRIAHLIAGAAVAALTSLAFASAAVAVETLPLKEAHKNKTAAGFDGKTCDGPFAGLPKDQDGWHFVLKGGGSFDSLSLTFEKSGGGTVNLEITSTDKNAPSSGTGWKGYIDNAGASGADKHAYVFTDAGWTLKDGSASVENAIGTDFVLSHTCAGTPDTSTPTPDPTRTPDPDPSDGENPDPSTSASTPGGDLPITGAKVGGFAIAGVALLAGGVALLAVRRRRQITEG